MSTPAAPPDVDADDNRILSVMKGIQTGAESIAEAQATNATVLPREETSQSTREVQIMNPKGKYVYMLLKDSKKKRQAGISKEKKA